MSRSLNPRHYTSPHQNVWVSVTRLLNQKNKFNHNYDNKKQLVPVYFPTLYFLSLVSYTPCSLSNDMQTYLILMHSFKTLFFSLSHFFYYIINNITSISLFLFLKMSSVFWMSIKCFHCSFHIISPCTISSCEPKLLNGAPIEKQYDGEIHRSQIKRENTSIPIMVSVHFLHLNNVIRTL